MDVAEELLENDHTIDPAYVERRLAERRTRVGNLDAGIQAWSPAAWSREDGQPVPILEDPMLRFDVPRQMIPTQTLLRDGTKAGRPELRGLCIIGANRRLDLITPSHHATIVERAESFERPKCTIMPPRDRLKREPLTAETLKASLD